MFGSLDYYYYLKNCVVCMFKIMKCRGVTR